MKSPRSFPSGTLFAFSCCLAAVLGLTATGVAVGQQPAPCPRPDSLGVLVEFLDVGQGDAVLLRTPDGRAALVDGGPGTDPLQRLLTERQVRGLALVVASHNHLDHIGGLPAALRQLQVGAVMDNGMPATTAVYRRLLDAVEERKVRLLAPSARTLTLGEVTLRVLPPWPEAKDQNDASIGLVIRLGEFSAILTGDAERRALTHWLRTADLGQVTVAKMGHHGSRNATTASWATRLRPKVVVASLAAGNSYGHPHTEAVQLWQQAGSRILRTDRHGTVAIRGCRDGSFRLATERGTP